MDKDIPEGRGSTLAGALAIGSPHPAARDANPGSAVPGGVAAPSSIEPTTGEHYAVLDELDHRGRHIEDGELGFRIRESEWRVIRDSFRRRKPITFNLSQATLLLTMFGGEDSEITVTWETEANSGPGMYAHYTEYPEEGYELLDPKREVAAASATRAPESEPAVAWLIVRHSGTSAPEREVVLSPLTDDTFMDEGDEAWPLVIRRRADGTAKEAK